MTLHPGEALQDLERYAWRLRTGLGVPPPARLRRLAAVLAAADR
ncbi:hypothetical protein ACWGB8_22685 [Kitasatospora sp. NPDC054939]